MDFLQIEDKIIDVYLETLIRHREIRIDFKKKTIKINPSIEIKHRIYNYKNIFELSNNTLLECLIYYLQPHDILGLSYTCKYMKKFLCDKQIPIIFDTEELIIDTIKK